MSLVGSLRSKGVQLAGQAMTKLFEDEKRAAQIGELIGKIQQGRKRLDAVQESALQSLGLVSSGELRARVAKQFTEQADPFFGTARIWDDGLIEPADTRNVLGLCLSVCAQQPPAEGSFRVFRM